MSELEQELTLCLDQVRAPKSVWCRVEAELFQAPSRRRPVLRPALGLLTIILMCVAAWSIGTRTSPVVPSKASSLPDNSRHACIVCHG
jgi:hypothetical protein